MIKDCDRKTLFYRVLLSSKSWLHILWPLTGFQTSNPWAVNQGAIQLRHKAIAVGNNNLIAGCKYKMCKLQV
jgi:hypothetical protein